MARHCAQVYEQKRTGYQCPVRVAVRSARCGPARSAEGARLRESSGVQLYGGGYY